MPVSISPGQIALTRMPVPDKLLGGGLDEVDDPGLGRRISRAAGARAQAGDARGADDRPAAARFQSGGGVLDRQERPDQIDAQDLGPILGGLLGDRGEAARDAGVGEKYVEPAMFVKRRVRRARRTSASRPASARTRASATSAPTTAAPSRRNRSAAARPMPDAAPVTIATLPPRRLCPCSLP